MCPDCISVIAVAIAVATPPSAVKAFLGRIGERLAMPGSGIGWKRPGVCDGVTEWERRNNPDRRRHLSL
jgi:hypothetical protein